MWDGLQPLARRPGVHEPDPVRTRRAKVANTEKKAKKYPAVLNPWGLTGAQFACFKLLVQGQCQAAAARQLCMSRKTMATHIERAKDKMEAANSTHALLMFDRWDQADQARTRESAT